MTWAFLTIAIVSEVAGTLSLRASDGFRKAIWLVPTLIGYVVAFGALSLTLAGGMPVGVAYGIWAACGVALTAVVARLVFKDPLTWLMGVGIVLIACGVLVIDVASAAHR
jgi:small multidrug resistance pump